MDRTSPPVTLPAVSYVATDQKSVRAEYSNPVIAMPFPENQPQLDMAGNIHISVFRAMPSQKEIALKQISVDDSAIKKANLEMQELKRMAEPPAYAKNLAYAEAICKTVRGFVPLGTNTANDAPKNKMTFEKKVELINVLRGEVHDWVAEYKSHHRDYPTEIQSYVACTAALKKHKYGHCGELTKAAFVEAMNNPDISDIHYCATSEGKHAFIVIGKRNGPKWEENAVVCDAWAEKCYPVAKFHEMQKPENDVKYAQEFYLEKNLWLFTDKQAPRPYLAGTIEVKQLFTRPG